VLARADRIIVLKDGQVEAEGSLERLLLDSDEFRLLWHGEALAERKRDGLADVAG
jgi:ATP-binding cassette subfamily B protein